MWAFMSVWFIVAIYAGARLIQNKISLGQTLYVQFGRAQPWTDVLCKWTTSKWSLKEVHNLLSTFTSNAKYFRFLCCFSSLLCWVVFFLRRNGAFWVFDWRYSWHPSFGISMWPPRRTGGTKWVFKNKLTPGASRVCGDLFWSTYILIGFEKSQGFF